MKILPFLSILLSEVQDLRPEHAIYYTKLLRYLIVI